MSISSVTASPLAAPSVTPAAASNAASVSGTQTTDSFMQLLVAQIENQDPTKPMDASAMTAQMSQLNVVSGINQLNTTLTAMASSSQRSDAMQAASLIGHSVMVPGNSLQLANGSAKMGLQLDQSASDVQINILDSSGNVVNTQDLGAQAAGLQNLTWDGSTNSGASLGTPPYTFTVTATNAGQVVPTSAITPLAVATVNNVVMAGGVTSLNVASSGDAAKNVSMSNIYEVIS